MMFEKKGVVLVDVRHFVSKNGKPLDFAVIADPATYENLESLLGSDVNVNELVRGSRYTAKMSISGRYSNLTLIPEK